MVNTKFRNEIERIKNEIVRSVMTGNLNPTVTLCQAYSRENSCMYDRILDYFDYYGYKPYLILSSNVLSEGDKVLMRVTVTEPEWGGVFYGKIIL